MKWLLGSSDMTLNALDAEDPDLSDSQYLPDTAALADRPRSCLEESDEVPRDFTTLFDTSMFGFDVSLIPEVIKAYEVSALSFVFHLSDPY